MAANTGLAVFIALLYLVFGFFILYLLVQMVLRLALIDILLCLAPIALGLWILPHTAGWGKHWLRLFRPPCSSRRCSSSPSPWPSGSWTGSPTSAGRGGPGPGVDAADGIAFMYLAGRIPSMLGHHGTFDAWLHTLYFGMSCPVRWCAPAAPGPAGRGSRRRAGRCGSRSSGGQVPRPAPPRAR